MSSWTTGVGPPGRHAVVTRVRARQEDVGRLAVPGDRGVRMEDLHHLIPFRRWPRRHPFATPGLIRYSSSCTSCRTPRGTHTVSTVNFPLALCLTPLGT